MSKVITKYPQLGIVKKTRNNGTIYMGIGLTRNEPPKIRNPPLTQKEKDERHIAKKIIR